MLHFLTGRLIQAIIVLMTMSVLIQGLITLMPGDPIDLMITTDPRITSEQIDALRKAYGLDQSFWQRYGNWLHMVLSGDLGYSRLYAMSVSDILSSRLINTAMLLGLGLLFSLMIAFPIGIAAAQRPHSSFDVTINMLCFAGISIPPFWLALILIIVFAVTLGWLPAGGIAPIGPHYWWERLEYAILPLVTFIIVTVGVYIRYIRIAVRNTMHHDYIRTARAKGLSESKVVWNHALRNALIPVVTVIALDFGTLFSGTLIIETVFDWPGMGSLIYKAIQGNDYPIAMVSLLIVTAMTLTGNYLADIVYALIDPRIRIDRHGR